MPEQSAQPTEAPPEAGIEMAELGTSHSSGGGQPLLDSGGEAQVPGASRGAQRRCCSTLVLSRSVLVGTLVLVLAASGIAIWQLVDRHAENHIVAWFVGGIFTALSVPITLYDITQHWMHWYSERQRYYVRILGMVIIYAVESWTALRFKEASLYLETARDAYEAYVIYCFYQLLLLSIGGEQDVIRALKAAGKAHSTTKKAQTASSGSGFQALQPSPSPKAVSDEEAGPSSPDAVEEHFASHVPPFCCLPKWRLGSDFLHWTSLGVFQYVVLKLVATVVSFVTTATGDYGNGEFHAFDKAFIYVSFTVNASQIWAMYCLVLFYHELLPALKPLGILPVGKLLVIKGVVFLTWWQGIVLSGLVFVGYIKPTLTYTADEVADGLQNFLITIEMLLFAVAHHFVFHWTDCAPPGSPAAGGGGARQRSLLTSVDAADATPTQQSFLQAAASSILPTDMVHHGKRVLSRKRANTLEDGEEEDSQARPGALQTGQATHLADSRSARVAAARQS